MTAEAVKALEERGWNTKDLAGDALKWTVVLRWADDMYSASFEPQDKKKEQVLEREQVLL